MNKVLYGIFLIAFQVSFSQSKISGTIVSASNEPVAYAHVFIQETKQGTTTNENGFFNLENVSPGSFTIQVSFVGFKSAYKSIELQSNETRELTITLQSDTDLDEVEVFGSRFKHPDKIEALTRLPLEPYEQIQSISIISDKLIEQQGNLTISEATKNVPGVYTFATYGNKRESMSSRGFRGIPILKNGVRVNSDFRGVGVLTDMQGIDNIQVLKGTASITQGVATDLGSPGGVINMVTKTPRYYNGGEVSLRVGSYGQVRPTFDVYGPINKQKNLAFRINGALERADSYRSLVSSERFYINPSLEWRIDDKTKVTVEMDYFDDSRTPDLGTVNLGENDVNAIYDLPHNQFLGFENDRSITQNATYSIRLDHKLTDKLVLKGAFFSSGLDLNDKGAGLGNVVSVANEPQYQMRARNYSTSTRSDNNSVLQFDLIGDELETGKIKHTFQVGFDYRTSKYATTSQSAGVVDTINVYQNNSNILPGLTLGATDYNGGETRALGLVAQDVISWNTWLKTFLGARISSTETIGEVENTRSTAFNPLFGVIVSPLKNVNVFTSYTNSSYPRTAARLGENGEELGNERYDQLEAGIKTNWLNSRLRFNLTYFKINNKDINLPVYDDSWSTILYYEKGGNDQRQGIEVELTGRVLENFEVIAGYSYIDAEYKEHTSFVYGSSPLNTPNHTFNLYGNYTFKGQLEGLSLGAGAYYTGERPVNDWSSGAITHEGIVPNQKPFDVDAYTLVNMQAAYTFNKHWQARLLLNNVFNEIGYNTYRTRYINQTDPRSFAAILNYRF
ncbi:MULTISPECIES: TonB-dependent receptor [Bizionia]|uniref:TonB-dependent receptor n=1 Tax=Bizionia algoritergicola TaxID=291187 RepID=A0A5D0QSJ4_9FLAO|nr:MULTISPECIES: TonB-dependent receptor [Bizionia]OBX21243.1 TonB-dependent receptor [Bizionia sp. APA-3]TYB71661.1 TonB-dependent receptor [Bizionia algoritergicola]